MTTRFEGLDPDETILRWTPASFAGSAATSLRGAFSMSPGRIRRREVGAWLKVADQCGFPAAGGDMVLGISDRQRIHVWAPRFWWPRPGHHAGWFPCARVTQAGIARTGSAVRMTLLIDDGTLLGFESLRSGRLRRFTELVNEAANAR